ncbi:MAG: hypothetical protein JEZ06_00060 [Anaerolineaceae bacterium]|nr:hypothetical protein [Anaerolineaceae bacterium]
MPRSIPIILSIMFIFLIMGCNWPFLNAEASGPEVFYTEAAKTSQAKLTQGAIFNIPSIEATQKPGTTPEPAQNSTQQSAELDTKTVQVSATPTVRCDWAEFIKDVNVPDGTQFLPGESFTKIWQLKNIGSCTWETGYELVFDKDAAMNGPSAKPLVDPIAAGETIEISVDLTAPITAGTYKGYWKLRNDSGQEFGIGKKADDPFYVEIEVIEPIFAVLSANAIVTPKTWSSSCNPAVLNFSSEIKVSKAGDVQYHWVFSEAPETTTETLHFDQAGQKTVNTQLSLNKASGNWTGNGALYIDHPNHQLFNAAEYTLNCP